MGETVRGRTGRINEECVNMGIHETEVTTNKRCRPWLIFDAEPKRTGTKHHQESSRTASTSRRAACE
jgi:hypothetical protein